MMNIHNYTCDEHFLQMGSDNVHRCLNVFSGVEKKCFEVDDDKMSGGEGSRNIMRILNCITSTYDNKL